MRAVDLIRLKRDGGTLDEAAIRAFVAGATDGSWPDYQVAALLMAVVWRGMSAPEAAALTRAMVESGDRLDLGEDRARAVDKHSTGGVGDKISLVAAPLAAACGVLVPMVSGRGLGHTGGTLDKLEAIPGFRTRLSLTEARRLLRRTGCVFLGQTDEIAPADRRLYALRDVTGTVESVPLIAASILSKKIAEGIGGLVLDVKVGLGAFMKTDSLARELATALIDIAAEHGVRTTAVLSRMDAPLGRAVGNAHEVVEAIETLKGRGPADVEQLSVLIAARMVLLAGLARGASDAERRVRQALISGAGLDKLREIVTAQGGDSAVIDDYGRLPASPLQETVNARARGVVVGLHAERVGQAAVALGAGRDRVDSTIDPGAGIEVLAAVGSEVTEGEPILVLTASEVARLEAARAVLADAVTIAPALADRRPLVLDVLTRPAA
jgi:pyrimidine-nucleoside phosphorylase